MTALIWIGGAMTVAGLAGLVCCIVIAARARSRGLEGAAMEERLRRLVALNLGALAVSALGLMLVVTGVILA
ncbi:hypothetical protein MWU52_07640 [Jannaschia sp. S6380]|uniref:hypothetical protein n=1 Tax=Jannaschia sp. S6380 TaxID=2926408 RepID=UPI001FF129A2|nr:hypothetical protein [Jannaschia sp. S6380]MCK0167414.1 hypothetical protein [Jannaschia sp. S6380]